MNPNIKNVLGGAVVLAVLAVAYAAFAYSKSVQPGGYREFAVTGEGKVVAVPDVAQFTFSVITEGGKDLAALQKSNVEKMNKAITFVKSKGVDAKDIKTESYNVQPRYSTCVPQPIPIGEGTAGSNYYMGEVCPPSSITGYTISQTVAVKVRDFSKVGEAMGGVVDNGANQVYGPNFTLDDPVKVQNEAREKAITQAREKAESIADAGGFRLGKLIAIEEGGVYSPYLYGRGGGEMMAVDAKTPAPTIEPGSQDVTVNVTLRYQIR